MPFEASAISSGTLVGRTAGTKQLDLAKRIFKTGYEKKFCRVCCAVAVDAGTQRMSCSSSTVWRRDVDTDLNKYSHGRNIMGIFRPGVDAQPMIFETSKSRM